MAFRLQKFYLGDTIPEGSRLVKEHFEIRICTRYGYPHTENVDVFYYEVPVEGERRGCKKTGGVKIPSFGATPKKGDFFKYEGEFMTEDWR